MSLADFSQVSIVPMGQFDISGQTCRFRPLGNGEDGFAPCSVGPGADADTMSWHPM